VPNAHDDNVPYRVGKIEERNDALNARLDNLAAAVQAVTGKQDMIGEHLSRQDKTCGEIQVGVQDIQTILKGDGKSNPGVVARLANVERAVTNWVKAGWLVIGAVVTLSVNFVRSLINGGKPPGP
jgi:hypothetical protein